MQLKILVYFIGLISSIQSIEGLANSDVTRKLVKMFSTVCAWPVGFLIYSMEENKVYVP